MAFWQSLISHFTYFSPQPLEEIQQQGWGTLDHVNSSLVKDFDNNGVALEAWIEKETLEFYPSPEVFCSSHTKIYAENMVDRNNASDSIAEWLIKMDIEILKLRITTPNTRVNLCLFRNCTVNIS